MSVCYPTINDRKAGKAMSDARRMPSPPLTTGSVAWPLSHTSCDKATFLMSCRVNRMTPSYSNSS